MNNSEAFNYYFGDDSIDELPEDPYAVSADLEAWEEFDDINLQLEKEIQEFADEKVKIPMLGKTESLNASVATGIVLYEYVRRKVKNK